MTAAALTPAQSRFIEEMGQFLGGYGMTPMAGRMWGWLLLCEPPEQTAAEIAEALDSMLGSAASIYRQMRTIAERGLAATADRPQASRARLQEFHDVMAFVEREVPLVISRFLADRKQGVA